MSCSLTNLKYAILRFQKLFSIIAFEWFFREKVDDIIGSTSCTEHKLQAHLPTEELW